MTTARYIVGDTRDVTATLPDASVDLVMTSPPFLALRSYLPVDHPDKHREIGSEPGPAEFLQTLLELTAEWRRVLAPHGSICVELGDTYSGSGGAGGDYNEGGLRDGAPKFSGSAMSYRKTAVRNRDLVAWPLDKSMCGIPWLYSLSLAYGRNLLTGQPSPAGQWRVRNVVAWCRPNPPVGALGDKFRPATSYLTIATVARDRYFDLDAVRTPLSGKRKADTSDVTKEPNKIARGNFNTLGPYDPEQSAGAPPLDYWVIPTQPYSGSHYATYPPDLCTRPILSMCPQRVCTVCGQPSRRVTSEPEYVPSATNRGGSMMSDAERVAPGANQWVGTAGARASVIRSTDTIGWTDCGHDAWRNGVVLDPFGGSGTTGMVATGHGRDAILVDIDDRNADLAAERIGMFLTVEHHERGAA